MMSPFSTLEAEPESIAIAFQTSVIFEHYDTIVDAAMPAANEDPFDGYENLYLVPVG